MKGQWELIRINTNLDWVTWYAPMSYKLNFKVKDFILEHFSGMQLTDTVPYYHDLIGELLKDGWEPYAAAYEEKHEVLYFRKRA